MAKNYFLIERDTYEQLTPIQFLVFCEILWRARYNGPTQVKGKQLEVGEAFLGKDDIARRLKCSRRAVQKAIIMLCEKSHLEFTVSSHLGTHVKVRDLSLISNARTTESHQGRISSSPNIPSTNQVTKKPKNRVLSGKPDILQSEGALLEEITKVLNEKAGTSYRANTADMRTFALARIREGFVAEDFKKVIEIKVSEWKGTDWAKYLRPETLFGKKFQSYLNQEAAGECADPLFSL